MTIQPNTHKRREIKAIKDLPVTNSKTDEFTRLTDLMKSVYIAKNHDYGNAFTKSIEEFGLTAAAVRMNDKMERIKSFAKMTPSDMKVKSESIEDTLLDLANYAVMTIVELKALDKKKSSIEIAEAPKNLFR